MRKPRIIALGLILSTVALAQRPNLDSLYRAAASQQGVQKISTLNAIASALLPQDPDSARLTAEEAFQLAVAINDQTGTANALDNLGQVFEAKLDYRRAMESYLEALKIRDLANDVRGRAISKTNIGRVFYLMEDFTHAEENLVRSLELWTEVKDETGAAKTYEYLGDLYLAREFYGKALEHFQQALDLKLAAGEVQGAAKIATLQGQIALGLGNYEGAIFYYRTALDLHRELNNLPEIATGHANISRVLLAQSDFEEALANNLHALDIRTRLRDTFGMAQSEELFGSIFLKMKNPAEASNHFLASAELLENQPVRASTPEIYLAIAGGFERLGDFFKAYEFHRDFARTRNEVFDQEKAKALLDLTTKYESEFAAKEQQQRIALLEMENETSRQIRYFLITLLAMFAILLVNFFISYQRKKKDNSLLLEKNEEISRQKEEIDDKNEELQQKNISLDLLNKRLVDEMAERENIEKSSFARDRFLATMSHEMRTPINIINGLTHILLDSHPREDQIEQLRTLQYAANDLIVFINDVLDFSKIEAGKLDLENREFTPRLTFSEIRRQFEDKVARKKNLHFHFSYDHKIPDTLLGDNARLHQILNYLISNALQYTEAGSVKTDVVLEELNAREAMLKVRIEGTDGGMERKILEDVFRPWSDTEEEFEGYEGEQLSLAIAKRLIELQNGKLDLSILAGTSTVFTIHLPYKLPVPEKKAEQQKPVADYTHLAGTRILVVEDNKINQLVVAKLLRKLGIEVTTANHGLEALEIYEREDFDLILMDIQMPEMDGYRATAEIRRHPVEAKRNVPVIALTASAFLTEKEKAILFGMNDHVGKPFSPDELLEKITACLAVYRET